VQVTHPFHPLHGGTFEVVDRRRCHEEYLYLEVGAERVERLPARWTSAGGVDPFVQLSAGRSLFRVDDLVRLAELVAEMGGAAREQAGDEV
jgi:hypothetical protein